MRPGPAVWMALATTALAAAEAVAPFEVKVIPPDFVFRFAPRVELPGRPSLALVLSGGGARAVAHIGALQRMDELGVPVDSITGTSAGALMGALAACGYSGRDIEELFTRVDFNRAFLDPLLRSPGRTLQEDEADNGTFLSIQTEGGRPSFALSLRDGVEIQRALEGLLARGAYFSGASFDRLKIPLRVVATNLETGQGRVFDDGDLVEVLRASMAVPGAFSPVQIGGQPYVDGALVENLPVFVARESFAPDLTLAVDVSSPLEAASVSNFFSLAARSLDLVVERRQWESRAAASILVHPELKGAGFTDYGREVPALVAAGRKAFDEQIPALKAAMLDPLGGEEVLPARRAEFEVSRPLPPEATAMLARVLPGGEIRRKDVLVALQQMLLHGWAKEVRAAVVDQGAEPVLRFEFTPFGRVERYALEAPAAWRGQLEAGLRRILPPGEPFNPEVFGAFVGDWVQRIVLDGTPLVDVRGSGFDDAAGVLRLVVREPVVRAVTVLGAGKKSEFDYLKASLAGMIGQPLRTARLRQDIDLAERRLQLMELRYQLKPGDEGVDLTLVPVHHKSQSLSLSLGYDSGLDAQTGFTYRSVNFGGVGVEGEIGGLRNRLQDQVYLEVGGPVAPSYPATGVVFRGSSTRQRLDGPLAFPGAVIPAGAGDGRIGRMDLGVGGFIRYGSLGQGKASVDAGWREAAASWSGGRDVSHQRTAELSAEWDNLDRHTFPRDGLLLRGRYGLGETVGQGTSFRFGYLRARGLSSFGSARALASPGLDLDLEWGCGDRLPVDRWWTLGGTSFLMGSRAMGYLAPQFLVGRLGLPVQFPGPYGLSFQAVPRFDYGLLAGEAGDLFAANRGQAAGLMLRTILARFYVELSWGYLRTSDPANGWTRPSGSFAALVGTQPFDIWTRR